MGSTTQVLKRRNAIGEGSPSTLKLIAAAIVIIVLGGIIAFAWATNQKPSGGGTANNIVMPPLPTADPRHDDTGKCYKDMGNDVLQEVPCPEDTPEPTEPPFNGDELAECPEVGEMNNLFADGADALVPEGSPSTGEWCLYETKANGYWLDHALPCNADFALEMDTVGPEGLYWFCEQNDTEREFWVDHASIRLVPAYPSGNPIQDPCEALDNSRDWLIEFSNPDWAPKLRPGNFSCDGEEATGGPNYGGALQNGKPDNDGGSNANACPDTKADALEALDYPGGNKYWSQLSDGRWKYNLNQSNRAPAIDVDAPWGTLDWWNGSTHMGTRSANNATELTWDCTKS